MSIKNKLLSVLKLIRRIPGLASLIDRPALRRVLEKLPGGRTLYPTGWDRVHPFDVLNGTDTSGRVPLEELSIDAAALEGAHLYGGSQPSVLRALLEKIPNPETFAFVDLGCGKGRPLFIATEFPFREVIGVELSPPLTAIAIRNAQIMSARYPERTAVSVVLGDATAFELPAGDVVLFLYNPFGESLIRKVVANVERALEDGTRRVFVVYYNPVFGTCFDESRRLSRRFAATLSYADDEVGYGPDNADPVIIWGPGDGQMVPGTEARIRVVTPEMRCELVD